MRLGDWLDKLDHVKISCSFVLPECRKSSQSKPWSIPQPQLTSLSNEQRKQCKDAVNSELSPLLALVRSSILSLEEVDDLSKKLAQKLVQATSEVVGSKRPTHEKGKFQSVDLVKCQAEINTINKARDLIRTLAMNEVRDKKDRDEVQNHLNVLLDRLVHMGLSSVPRSLEIDILQEWSQSLALLDLESLRDYMEVQKETLTLRDKEKSKKMFLDPKKRGKWLDLIFKGQISSCPNFAIDSKSGTRSFDEKEVKRVYLQEGAVFLKTKYDIRPPFDEKTEDRRTPPPNPMNREKKIPPKPNQLPRWWNRMYNRKAKSIQETASGFLLVRDPSCFCIC